MGRKRSVMRQQTTATILKSCNDGICQLLRAENAFSSSFMIPERKAALMAESDRLIEEAWLAERHFRDLRRNKSFGR